MSVHAMSFNNVNRPFQSYLPFSFQVRGKAKEHVEPKKRTLRPTARVVDARIKDRWRDSIDVKTSTAPFGTPLSDYQR